MQLGGACPVAVSVAFLDRHICFFRRLSSLRLSRTLKNGKVGSFHCYVAVPILLGQLGVFKNLSAAIRR
jgi:hypothetical protein